MTASRLLGGVLVSPVWDGGLNAEAEQLVANMGDTPPEVSCSAIANPGKRWVAHAVLGLSD